MKSHYRVKLIGNRSVKISRGPALAVIGAVSLVGVVVVVRSFAATVPASFEAEQGRLTAPASVATLNGASGGSAVKFGASTPAPATPTPPPTTISQGVWLSKAEIMAKPMSGAAWDKLKSAALGSWGSPDLSDNNNQHDTMTLAGALYAARTGDAAVTAKTRAAIMSVRNSGYSRVLEMSRNITDYVIAADIIGLPAADEASFKSFVSDLRTKPLAGHSGAKNMYQTALMSANNWGSMSRAAMAAIDVYLGDKAQLAQISLAMRAWLGESSIDNQLVKTSTSWRANAADIGINRRGATISGRNVDGVQPEDQRRTGDFAWPAPKGSYPWESLQGAIIAMNIMSRAGAIQLNAGDSAIPRAYAWLYNVNSNPASGDDLWQPWIVNKLYGTSYETAPATIGKNMGWTDWTHAK